MNATTVVLIGVHPLFREGLRRCLTETGEFYVIGDADNGQQAIQIIDKHEPDIALIDVDLPGVSGLEVSRVITRSHPRTRVVLLGSTMDGSDVIKAIRARVAAYVPQNIAPEALLLTLQRVRRGDFPINDLAISSPDIAVRIIDEFRHMVWNDDHQNIYSPLSPRELQVLELIATGYSNKAIAQSLDISDQTVKNHISSIMRKLAVNDRVQAVMTAIHRGWIKFPPRDTAHP